MLYMIGFSLFCFQIQSLSQWSQKLVQGFFYGLKNQGGTFLLGYQIVFGISPVRLFSVGCFFWVLSNMYVYNIAANLNNWLLNTQFWILKHLINGQQAILINNYKIDILHCIVLNVEFLQIICLKILMSLLIIGCNSTNR